MNGVIKDDMELFKRFSDDADFRRGLTDLIFRLTYARPAAGGSPGV
jgi:hypothetical protein